MSAEMTNPSGVPFAREPLPTAAETNMRRAMSDWLHTKVQAAAPHPPGLRRLAYDAFLAVADGPTNVPLPLVYAPDVLAYLAAPPFRAVEEVDGRHLLAVAGADRVAATAFALSLAALAEAADALAARVWQPLFTPPPPDVRAALDRTARQPEAPCPSTT